MNKFLTFPGMQPVYLGDIDFLQQAVRDTFLQLLVGLTGKSNPSCILKKATATEDGVICLEGEIMPYKAYAGTELVPKAYRVMTSYSGARVFKNGETHECHEMRYVQELRAAVPSDPLPMLENLLRAEVKTFSGVTNASDEVQYRTSQLGNRVDYEVTVTFASETTTEYLCTDIGLNFSDSSVISQSPKYCNAVVDKGDLLSMLPVKIILSVNEDYPGTASMTITTNRATFASGTKVTLNFTVFK